MIILSKHPTISFFIISLDQLIQDSAESFNCHCYEIYSDDGFCLILGSFPQKYMFQINFFKSLMKKNINFWNFEKKIFWEIFITFSTNSKFWGFVEKLYSIFWFQTKWWSLVNKIPWCFVRKIWFSYRL